jgi:putative ABC transport system permease protein
MDLAFFFMGEEGLERFNIPPGTFNYVFVRVTPYSPDNAKEVASAIKDKLAKQNIRVLALSYQDPDKHWGNAFMDSFLLVQKFLALVCVGMSLVLVYNTLSNLITQQTNQIGILKAIGASSGKIVAIYMISAFFYGLLALLISIPLGALVAFYVTKVFLDLFNIDLTGFQISSQAITYQVICAVAAPLIAGLIPTIKGAGITVRQAIASYGLGGDYSTGWLDRLVDAIGRRWLSSQYATALGNMFRHKGRLFLTQLVLVAAGGAFLLVMSLNSSIGLTLEHIFAREKYDTVIQFEENQRLERVQTLAKLVPQVQDTEMQLYLSASLILSNRRLKEANISTSLRGIPADTDFYEPLIVAGRWLVPGDGQVVVINRKAAEDNHIQVGDVITLDLGVMGKKDFRVIGIYDPIFVGSFSSNTLYAPLDVVFNVSKKYHQATLLFVRTNLHDRQTVSEVTAKLKDYFDNRNMKVSISETTFAARDRANWQFNIVIWMMLALSVIVALVGSITLMGALSIGVIERTKEIGVLRALGARSSTILGIFIMEGVLQGLASWLVAIPLSYITAPVVASALGKAMFGATLDYQYNWSALGIWFGLVLFISILASILPARSATKISVRDSLAYA